MALAGTQKPPHATREQQRALRHSVLTHVPLPSAACSTAPMALLWTSEMADTGHAWPGKMEALGGMDGTDAALLFFGNVRSRPRTPIISSASAFAGLLDTLRKCDGHVLPPALTPPGWGLSMGACYDLEAQVSVPELTPPPDTPWFQGLSR
jgi:hypothetical protein